VIRMADGGDKARFGEDLIAGEHGVRSGNIRLVTSGRAWLGNAKSRTDNGLPDLTCQVLLPPLHSLRRGFAGSG